MDKRDTPIGIQVVGSIILATITVVGYVLWVLGGYLTIREHQEFVNRYNGDIKRLETMDVEHAKQMASKAEMLLMQKQIDLLMSRSLI